MGDQGLKTFDPILPPRIAFLILFTCFPWFWFDFAMVFAWCCNGLGMVLTLFFAWFCMLFLGVGMVLACFGMVFPWFGHGVGIDLQWFWECLTVALA